MIKSISLSNFQSHSDSHLDLSEGVNIILGASDSGKSAIIRAIKWLVTNKPSGDAFRSSWGGKTQVEIFTDDVHVVRSRDKENEYVLGDMHFKAFSTDVPKEITDALRFDGNNLQAQLDQPFLLSETPGDVAAHWNKIAKLESIDKGTANVNSAIRELNSDIKYKTEQEVKLIEELKTYANIEIYEYDVEVLEDMEQKKNALGNSVSKLHTLTSSYRLLVNDIKQKSEILILEKPVNEIISYINEKKVIEANHDKLYGLIHDWYYNKSKKEHLEVTATMDKPVLELLELYKELNLRVEAQKRLSFALSSIMSIRDRIKNGMAYVALKHAEFEKEMPDICPLCGENRIKPSMTR